jgi:hypothetical protein
MRIEHAPVIPPTGRAVPPVRQGAPVQPSKEIRAYLSADEINYFAELERLGPLTYGRNGKSGDSQSPAPVLGARIDVRA